MIQKRQMINSYISCLQIQSMESYLEKPSYHNQKPYSFFQILFGEAKPPAPKLSKKEQQIEFLRARFKQGELHLSNGSGNVANLGLLGESLNTESIRVIYLQLNHNQKLPDQICLFEMHNLIELNLSSNIIDDISSLPLLNAQNLQILRLNDNRITTITPFAHLGCSQMTAIDLSRNSIRDADPFTLCNFDNLLELNLRQNLVMDFFPLISINFGMKMYGNNPKQVQLRSKNRTASANLVVNIQYNPGSQMVSQKIFSFAVLC